MFREGICPKCREKIQVPDDRETILCMFCGEEIRVDEALGKRTKGRSISSEEREQCMETARRAMEDLIEQCINPMDGFKKDRYETAFQDYYDQCRGLFEALDLMYTGTEQPKQCMEAVAAHLVESAQEALAKIHFKAKRNQKQMDYGFSVTVYLIPAVLKYPATFTDDFSDAVIRLWNEAFKTNLGKAGYEEIMSGFRTKLCYITTAVCESLGKGTDCYELQLLKKYRDEQLETTQEGHALVEEYYDIAPTIVKRLEREPDRQQRYRKLYEQYLEPCIKDIEAERYEQCKEHYEKMVQELKERYFH